MKLYENIVIGNFLYALGFAVRARLQAGVTGCAINLLQQTPADKLLGDLLLEFPGAVRLIEFKAQGNRSSKERARFEGLRAALQARRELVPISRAIHWYIETAPSQVGMDARISPYLDAYPRKPMEHRLEAFIESFADEVTGQRVSINKGNAAEYLKLVRLTQGGGEVASGGLLLVADEHGTVHYAPLRDMLELRLEHRNWLELHQQRAMIETRLELEIAERREKSRSRHRDRDREGPEMGG